MLASTFYIHILNSISTQRWLNPNYKINKLKLNRHAFSTKKIYKMKIWIIHILFEFEINNNNCDIVTKPGFEGDYTYFEIILMNNIIINL